MKISEKRIPQDGRIQVKVNGRDLDLLVAEIGEYPKLKGVKP